MKTWKTILSLAASAVMIGNGFSAVYAEGSSEADTGGAYFGRVEEMISSMKTALRL